MLKKIITSLFILAFLIIPFQRADASLAQTLSGKILLEVEKNGEAWYVYPENEKRYYLGRPADAFQIMRSLGLGISEQSFNSFNGYAPANLSGKILLRVEANGEAYYVYPPTKKLYYLGRPADAFQVMRELGIGITSDNLTKITKSDSAFNFQTKTVKTKNGNFKINMVTVDLTQSWVKTDTANTSDCADNCPVKTLKDFIEQNNAQVGIHGSYFCPSTYSSCTGQTGSYFYPVLNSRLNKLINASEIKWLQGSILVFDQNNKTHFYPNGPDFISQENFEATHGKIQALISNSPALIYNSQNIVASQNMDEKQRTAKASRGGIGIKGNTAYLIIATEATVPDLASIMETLEMEQALNLDGGGSSALYYNGGYQVGPGRNIGNAIIFGE